MEFSVFIPMTDFGFTGRQMHIVFWWGSHFENGFFGKLNIN
jgi:hypothetical protein